MKRLIVDLDGTITIESGLSYELKEPNKTMIKRLSEYREKGFIIVINTARNMNTFNGDVSKINTETLPIILEWLNRHNVPYDGVLVGKPWCGHEGFYIDDKAIRPSEFLSYSEVEIGELLEEERVRMEQFKCC